MISLDHVGVRFQGEELFSDISLLIGARDRIGLVGRNGTGKSTLFKVICGELEPSEGNVARAADLAIGHLAQHIAYSDTRSILDETLSAFGELKALEAKIEHLDTLLQQEHFQDAEEATEMAVRLAELTERYHLMGGAQQEAQAEQTLLGLGFEREQFSQPTATLSGGWRMRVELAKILLAGADLLLLDEPTNHLDIESIQWLENYLKDYRGALVLISHDRRFLDTVTTKTIEISLKHAYSFNVPYTKFKELRAEQREQQLAAYENQQELIEKTEDFIERFRYKPTKSNQVQARIKQLEKLERIEVEEEDNAKIHVRFPDAPRSGDVVVNVRDLTKRFDEHVVFQGANLAIRRGEKVAFVGRNGEGKTTLVRCIKGEIPYEVGELKIGHNVLVGYFAQNQKAVLNPEKTVYDTIDEIATGDIRTKIRDILAAFLFRGGDVDKKVQVLSGGERNRLAMAKLMLRPYNLLILDEPTNHLDMQAKDVLKQALLNYNGTLILVSHDRDFLDGLVEKVYEFSHGRVHEHLGGINAFLEHRRMQGLEELNQARAKKEDETKTKVSTEKSAAEKWKLKKQYENELNKRRKTIAKLEEQIAEHEQKLKELEDKMALLNEQSETKQLVQEYEKIQTANNALLKKWEEEAYELEIVENEGLSE